MVAFTDNPFTSSPHSRARPCTGGFNRNSTFNSPTTTITHLHLSVSLTVRLSKRSSPSDSASEFTYAAYGELLAIHNQQGIVVGQLAAPGLESQALTSLLYSGESFDSRIGQQYLRARWYDTAAGRFSRLDPYFGNLGDPLSFNKYLYVHSNPIFNVDPTGLFSLSSSLAGSTIGAQLNSFTSEAGQVVIESLQRKQVSFDAIGWQLAAGFLSIGGVVAGEFGDEIAAFLKRYGGDAIATGKNALNSLFHFAKSITNSALRSQTRALLKRFGRIVDAAGLRAATRTASGAYEFVGQGRFVRGFKNAGELAERVGNLKNKLIGAGVADLQIGVRGSAVTGKSSKGGFFRWLPGQAKASDVDFFFTSPTLERRFKHLGLFKDGRIKLDDLKRHAPALFDVIDEFSQESLQQLGRKADATLLESDLLRRIDPKSFITFG